MQTKREKRNRNFKKKERTRRRERKRERESERERDRQRARAKAIQQRLRNRNKKVFLFCFCTKHFTAREIGRARARVWEYNLSIGYMWFCQLSTVFFCFLVASITCYMYVCSIEIMFVNAFDTNKKKAHMRHIHKFVDIFHRCIYICIKMPSITHYY